MQSLRQYIPRWSVGVAVLSVLAALIGVVDSAHAHKRDFAFTYEWYTPARDEQEIESWITYSKDGSKLEPWVEYEFAVNDRWAMGLYATSERSSARSLGLTGWKWENRYAFGEYRPDHWLHAGYLELAKQRGEAYELEGKWILTRHSARTDEALAINVIAEKELTAGERVEWGYALGWNRPSGRDWRVGFESTGQLADGRYYVGPSATYDVNDRFRLILGTGVGLTQRSSGLLLRAVGEWEWF